MLTEEVDIINFLYSENSIYLIDVSRKGVVIKTKTFERLISTLKPEYGESVDDMVNRLLDSYDKRESQ